MKVNKYKFGIEVPTIVEESLGIDNQEINTFWQDSINKETKNCRLEFELHNQYEKVPVGYKKSTCHSIFDIKMDLIRKSQYVAKGHLTDPPSSMTYACAVSRDSVCIVLFIADLNDLKFLAVDIQNYYLNGPTKDKVFLCAKDE